jgi:dynein heavy chain, axonemal
MSRLENFNGIDKHFVENSDLYKLFYDSVKPEDMSLIPRPWNESLDSFEKLIFIKTFRSDKLLPAVQNWVEEKIG